MPRYFFQIIGGEHTPDIEGTELPDLAAARHVAVDIAADLLKGSHEEFWSSKHWRLEITDGIGLVLARFIMISEITTEFEAVTKHDHSAPA